MAPNCDKVNIVSLNVRSVLKMDKFRRMYDLFQRCKVDILLIQESGITRELQAYFQEAFPLISIAAHYVDDPDRVGMGRGAAMIINNKTTAWDQDDDQGHEIFHSGDGRLLICKVICRDRPITVGCAYAPARGEERAPWLIQVNEKLESFPLSSPCDVVGGDWNMTLETIDRVINTGVATAQQRLEFTRLIRNLGGGSNDLVDGWRLQHPDDREYSFFTGRDAIPTSRIDRIYVRDDWMEDSEGWGIAASGTSTDHKAITVTLCFARTSDRGPGRWRMSPLLLKRTRVREIAQQALEALPWIDPLAEWSTYKACISETMKTLVKGDRKATQRLGLTLRKRRQRLEKKRRPGRIRDRGLDERLALINAQEEHLAETFNHDYAYNAMAKHLMLNEKPSKWFFGRAKLFSNTGLESLTDQQGELQSGTEGVMRVAEEFYKELYATKPSEDSAREEILGCLDRCVTPRAATGLSALITVDEVEGAIQRAALGKSPGNDGLPSEYYKVLAPRPRKKAENRDHSLMAKRLTSLFNWVQRERKTPQGWVDGLLTILFKNKGLRTEIKNYRPLSIMNTDYKLFTDILMQRLVGALDQVIAPQQAGFLPERLIDDNIKAVQYLIARHGPDMKGAETREGIALLFLDQEKAYDRVSHEYLEEALRKVGIPEDFISWIRMLYSDASVRLFTNGHTGGRIPILCGVRQGDPLSCILFVLVIEGLARYIATSPAMKGVAVGNLWLKSLMYADDTVVVIRNQEEADAIMKILELYCRATGAKVNWAKSFLMRIGNLPAIEIPGVVDIPEGEAYKHLGIPVGVRIERPLKEFWESTLDKARNTVNTWSKFCLSIKGRVLTANACVMSLPRYALRFLEIPTGIKAELETEYYRLIWDNKVKGTIRDLHSCFPRDRGGIGGTDLESVIKANVVSQVMRSMKYPEAPFALLAREILVACGQSEQKEHIIRAVSNPWMQVYTGKWDHLPEPLRYTWLMWRRIKNDGGIVTVQPPQSTEELLATNMWYHPSVGAKNSGDAKKFNSLYWRDLWERGVRVFGQVWDPISEQIIIPDPRDPIHRGRMSASVKRLVESCLPPSWSRWMKTEGPLRFHWSPGRRPRSDFGISRIKEKGGRSVEVFVPFERVSQNMVYQKLLSRRLQGHNFSSRTEGPIMAYQERCNTSITESRVWAGARNEFGNPRIGDLLWRFLHQKVKTGSDLTWIPVELQRCPIHRVDLTHDHIWIRCTVAEAVWEEFALTWNSLGGAEAPLVRTMAELIAFMAICPRQVPKGPQRRRWEVLFQGAVWTLWKSYLTHWFEKPEKMWLPEAARKYYRSMIRTQIYSDRITCIYERYQSVKHSPETFEKVWGEAPRKMKVRKGPKCLDRDEAVPQGGYSLDNEENDLLSEREWGDMS